MVTVTGAGGIGKTRLADKVARGMAAEFADGVWLVELASVRDPSLVAAQMTATLELPAGDAAAFSAMIARRQLLIVLDNCEQVLASAAGLCAAILSAADDARILATSREPLGVPGEARYRLRPLSLPNEHGTEPGPGPGSEAVSLFADRARYADPHFSLSPENVPAVSRLVRRLDGMPLAIELAAARVEALGLTQLADGLDDRFRLLSGTDRTAAPRQRSLTATADWSYRLLPGPEQLAFRKLAIFPGGFTLEAACAVAGQDAAVAVLHLVDCSMIVPPQQGGDGRVRYTMLEILRVFGQDQLVQAGEADQAAQALARFAVGVAEQAAPQLLTDADVTAGKWLDAEAANLQQAVAWSLENDPPVALRLAVSLGLWWHRRYQYRAGYEALSRVVGLAEPGRGEWCTAQLWLGMLANGLLDLAGSLDHYGAVISALGDGAPTPVLIWALVNRGGTLANLGRLDEAAPFVHRALDCARQTGDAFGEAQALYWLSGISHYAGDQAGSLRWARQHATIDQARLPSKTALLGMTAQIIPLIEAGELAQARALCSTALDLSRLAGDGVYEAESLFNLARIELLSGHVATARARLRETLACAEHSAAEALHLIDSLDVCGHYFVRTGQPAAALTIWAAQAALLQADGIADPIEDSRRRSGPRHKARRQLGPAATRAAEDRGAAMTLQMAAEFARLVLDSDERKPPAAPGGAGLSPREQELVVLVARGLTDAQMAGQLFLSVSTVRSHLDRIRDKTGCRRRADLTRLALGAGLI
ncbi:MAG TPA: LuxR C-terminal-related transcriptional regulator [Streptosporangiaceae bacterium]|nr:LuxR C-terminal-related transcriptional regulator [Streptosporangiaceae bacterium]